MFKLTMTASLAGAEISLSPGQEHLCDRDEAVRFVDAGFATVHPDDADEFEAYAAEYRARVAERGEAVTVDPEAAAAKPAPARQRGAK